MKYALILALGIVTGLAFTRIPHYQPFRNETPPETPGEWTPKVRGNWSDEDMRTIDGYFGGGKN